MSNQPATEPSPKTTETSEPSEETKQTQEETKPAVPTFSQADVDKAVSKAINTREKTLREEAETQNLRETENFAELNKRQEATIKELKDGKKRSDFIAEHNLGEFASVLSNVPIDQLGTARDALTNSVNAAVLKQMAEKLETPAPVTGAPAPEKKVADMTTEEYKAHKKKKGVTY